MDYQVLTTDEFSKVIKKFNKHQELLNALDNKIKRLEENPYAVGKQLHGPLSHLHSTRLVAKFRLLFRIDEPQKMVYLETIDHRKDVYGPK